MTGSSLDSVLYSSVVVGYSSVVLSVGYGMEEVIKTGVLEMVVDSTSVDVSVEE